MIRGLRKRSRWRMGCLVAPVVTVSCGDAARMDGMGPGNAVRDSAGIRIVENHSPVWSDGEGWSVDPDPLLEIGVLEGAEPYQFASIAEATRRGDGVIAVAEADAHEVRLFGANGFHLRTIGRHGEGPGEFSAGPLVAWVSADTLLAWDPGSRRLTWFDEAGRAARERALQEVLAGLGVPLPGIPGAWEISKDPALLLRGGFSDTTRLRLIRPGAPVASLGDYPRGEGIVAGGWLVQHSFTPFPWRALRSGPPRALVAVSANREVAEFDSAGGLVALLRIAIPRVPIGDELMDVERERWRERAGPEGVDAFDRLSFPDSLPAIRRLHLDASGNLWVGRRSEPGQTATTELDILDPAGRWLGTVRTPEDAHPIYEIGEDYLLAGWRDDLDVLHVRMYRIVK